VTDPATIDRLVAARDLARQVKDWPRADALRAQIDALAYDLGPCRWGVSLMDGADGTQWHWSVVLTTPPGTPQSGPARD
jgi:cysteinyl-tRNA synthetase